jgi:pimeloyl-ACP methyl ester carboxylesterase
MRFVLVHGGMHGAWCWERLIPEIEALGHEVKTMDLPGHGTRQNEISTLDGYRDAVVEVLSPGDVLVGHSMGCPVATMAADVFTDLRHIVYLAGPLPVEGKHMMWDYEGQEEHLDVVEGGIIPSEDGKYFSYTPEGTKWFFYNDCTPEWASWAVSRLTPQRLDVLVSPISVPRFWEADLPRSFISGTIDRACPKVVADRICARLGVSPFTLESSHSPFLSRPAELAQLLMQAVDTKPTGPLKPFGVE